MKRFRNLLLTTAVVLSGLQLNAQETSNGRVYGKLYSNFHASFIESREDQSAFEVQRAYLGYKHNLDAHFNLNLLLDIGSPEQNSPYDLLKRYAYFKKAELSYQHNDLSINFGLIGMNLFNLQEKYWGYRYLYKSFQDEHKFGSSADLGLSVSYRFSPHLEVDASVMNGEGYNQLQNDNTYKTGLGITALPIKNLTLRWYGDYMAQSEAQITLAHFIGYTLPEIGQIGIEYNLQFNDRYREDHNRQGLSFYSTVYITDKWELFARYDKLSSNTIGSEPYNWNLAKDGSALVGGIEFAPTKHVHIALNYQDWVPYAANLGSEQSLYFSVEIAI
jgi:hypothetical protein